MEVSITKYILILCIHWASKPPLWGWWAGKRGEEKVNMQNGATNCSTTQRFLWPTGPLEIQEKQLITRTKRSFSPKCSTQKWPVRKMDAKYVCQQQGQGLPCTGAGRALLAHSVPPALPVHQHFQNSLPCCALQTCWGCVTSVPALLHPYKSFLGSCWGNKEENMGI